MKFTKILCALSLTLGTTSVLFAGNPKTDIKPSASESDKPLVTESKDPNILYWYQVTYNAEHMSGAVLSADAYVDEGEKEEISSPCAPGNQRDCLRGFAAPLSSFPAEDTGTDQIKKAL